MDNSVNSSSIKMESSWLNVLKKEFEQPYFQKIKAFLVQEKKAGKTVYPAGGKIFAAFDATPFDAVKVVILGQDPYHNPKQANGLSFSVNEGVQHPKSLINIFKEIETQTGAAYPQSGDLTPWAKQGVLLLNSILTVEAHQAASHRKIGWQQFTDAVIQHLSLQKKGIIFLLWGKFAQSKITLIDEKKHHILQSAHPSPLSAYRGFLGNEHFKKTNELLVEQEKTPINWKL